MTQTESTAATPAPVKRVTRIMLRHSIFFEQDYRAYLFVDGIKWKMKINEAGIVTILDGQDKVLLNLSPLLWEAIDYNSLPPREDF
jgi:hypothetical protein